MSAEDPFVRADELSVRRSPPYVTPAEMIATQPSARRAFDVFMELYGGAPKKLKRTESRHAKANDGSYTVRITDHDPFVLGTFGYDYPEVVRSQKEGDNIDYPEVLVSGFTNLGKLVHVRVYYDKKKLRSCFFVATADLGSGQVIEREVVGASFEREPQDIQNVFKTTLYLDGGNDDWPKEYWPQVQLGQQGPFYYSGGDSRIEHVHGIHRLSVSALGRVGMTASYLRAVQ